MASRKHNVSWVLIASFISSFLLSTSRASFLDDRKEKRFLIIPVFFQKYNALPSFYSYKYMLYVLQEFIVYMGDRPKDVVLALNLHSAMVKSVLGSLENNPILYQYKRSFNGFVVKLNRDEAEVMRKMAGVVSVFPNGIRQLHTTRSWDFMGVPLTVNRATTESDVVIGLLDSGIWPESESFTDSGMSPPPAKWKGTCGPFPDFKCNNKLIGARYYKGGVSLGPDDINSPRDSEGHGTHTASTAAGNAVNSASLLGLGLGTARGGVPSARIAVYKVCWSMGCTDSAILAAFDDAIADGVDIISVSLGGISALPFFLDAIAIGAFHAMKNGILTSVAAGNDGPKLYTVTNVAPWFVSVAASTIDRKFFTKVQLGNHEVLEGVSINTFDTSNVMYPLVYGGNIPNITGGYNSSSSRFCLRNTLDAAAVKGNVVLCDRLSSAFTVFMDGAAGTIMQDARFSDVAFSFPLPATHLDTINGSTVLTYALTSNPTATILKSTEGNDTFAPTVASFSSRGPSNITLDIIKPDIAAPGVDILAAYSPKSSISGVPGDTRSVPYNIVSGTSMACPHVSGIAAYVKSHNPTWSPAAIRSAIMTTALPMTGKNLESLEFAYGSGHVLPLSALNPGLVYDADMNDYISFLCGQGYNVLELSIVTGEFTTCPKTSSNAWDLNYPSFAYAASATTGLNRTFIRTVTNVGSPVSAYTATLTLSSGLTGLVDPATLLFTSVGQKLTFTVTVQGSIGPSTINSGTLVWDDGVHKVRSPVVVYAT